MPRLAAFGGQPGPWHAAAALAFGQFVLYPHRKLLQSGDCPVHVGSRAFDLLVALIRKAGQVVGHDELVAAVWPTSVVEENSLRVHMSALRRALGESQQHRYILTVPGHGYRFVMPVAPLPPSPSARPRQEPLPAMAAAQPTLSRLGRIIGRDAAICELASQVAAHRLVSLVEPGGSGKTTLARAYAGLDGATFGDGAVLVDLSQVHDASQVAATVVAALEIAAPRGQELDQLCGALHRRHLLLILDNCEHVIHAVATLAEAIADAAPKVRLLATSRAPLYTRGECIHRLAPLAAPREGELPGLAQAMAFPAIALFVERATANCHRFRLSEHNVALVAQLCRQLDGLPLAIELAAARVESLGVEGLAGRLDDLPGLLTRGRRTALPRHAALQAVFDCSYKLLSETERTVLRRLSVFRASFSLESAALVCAFGTASALDVSEGILTLAAKSLLAIDVAYGVARYRALNTGRSYAAGQLAHSGEADVVAERHARYVKSLLVRAAADLAAHPIDQWHAMYRSASGELMGALDWAFGDRGDTLLGIELAGLAPLPLIAPDMLGTHHKRIALALDKLAGIAAAPAADAPVLPLALLEMRLLSAWGSCTAHVAVRHSERAEMHARLMRMRPGDCPPECEILALSTMCASALTAGDYPGLDDLAACISVYAEAYGARGHVTAALFRLMAERWQAVAAHYLGRHGESQLLARRVVATQLPHDSARLLDPVPQAVSMRVVLARTEWIKGFPDRALDTARAAVSLSEGEHPFALCQALAMGLVPVAIWRGDTRLACEGVKQLLRHVQRHALTNWMQRANSLARVLHLPALPLPQDAGSANDVADSPQALDLLGTLDPRMLTAATVARVEAGDVLWCAPEVLRVEAERDLALQYSGPAAESQLWRASELARKQDALSWELRCALSLTTLWMRTARGAQAASLLGAVYAKFSEGANTADLVKARTLLEQAGSTGRPNLHAIMTPRPRTGAFNSD